MSWTVDEHLTRLPRSIFRPRPAVVAGSSPAQPPPSAETIYPEWPRFRSRIIQALNLHPECRPVVLYVLEHLDQCPDDPHDQPLFTPPA